jgi:hypothetical protein
VSGANSYSVSYTTDGGVSYTTINGILSSPVILVNDFPCNTIYSGFIKSNCPLISSSQTGFGPLQTPPCINPSPNVPKAFISGEFYSTTTSYNPEININSFNDPTFSDVITANAAPGYYPTIRAHALLSTGYLVGGDFNKINGTTRKGLAKLDADGLLDGSFTYTTGFVGPVSGFPDSYIIRAIAVDTNLSRIYVGGNFISYNGQPRNNIVALDMNGNVISLSAFNIGTGFYGTVLDIKVLSDSKILVAGEFTSYNTSISNKGLTKLNYNGTIASGFTTTFDTTLASPAIETIAVDSIGNIYAGGYFQKYQNQNITNLVKITSSGSLDATFNTGTNIDSNVPSNQAGGIHKVLIQGAKLLVGGEFKKYGTTETGAFMKLLISNGTIDPAYTKYVMPNIGSHSVSDIAISINGDVLLCGSLGNYLGYPVASNYFVTDPITGAINNTLTSPTPSNISQILHIIFSY